MVKILFSLLLLLFFSHFFFRVFEYGSHYTVPYDAGYWERRYGESQWVDFRSTKPIGDDGLYAYAGWKYVHGADPVLINAEMPFLGKYLLGFTILLLRNQNIFGVLTGLLALGSYYIFNLAFFKNRFLAFMPVFLFSLEPLFYEQLQAPFFDLLQLSFLFLLFLFTLRRQYVLSAIFLGCFAATKFPLQAVLPAAAIVLWIILSPPLRSDIKLYLSRLPLVLPVYMVTYFWYFILGHTLIDFLKVQKYILNFYLIGAKAPMLGTIFPMLFLGTWYTHFGTVLDVPEWRFSWTLLCITTLVAIFFIKKKPDTLLLHIYWILLYTLFLIFTPIFPRYLLLLLPFLYNLAIWVISKNTPEKCSLSLG